MSTLAQETGIRVQDHRKAEHPIEPFFLERWSPRAFSEALLSDAEIMTLFEAARWAPSSYNAQPWRMLYAKRGTPEWNTFLGLMVEFNQSWTQKASLLVVFISRKKFEHNGEAAPTHSFDTGSAWMSMALQASVKGWVAHGMQGFDYDKARKVLNVPEDYAVEAMAAFGKPGRSEELPEKLRLREYPSSRKPLEQIAFAGKFPA
jgi:nitroreductase